MQFKNVSGTTQDLPTLDLRVPRRGDVRGHR
jgi:hypothetical protein